MIVLVAVAPIEIDVAPDLVKIVSESDEVDALIVMLADAVSVIV